MSGRIDFALVTLCLVMSGCAGDGGLAGPGLATVDPRGRGEVAVEVSGAPALSEVPTVAQLEQVVTAYARCLAENLDGTIRFNAQRFGGMLEEVRLPSGLRDSEAIARERARCEALTSVDAVTSSFAAAHALDEAEVLAIASEFTSCLATLPGFSDVIESDQILTVDALVDVYTQLFRRSSGDESIRLTDCYETALYGPDLEIGL